MTAKGGDSPERPGREQGARPRRALLQSAGRRPRGGGPGLQHRVARAQEGCGCRGRLCETAGEEGLGDRLQVRAARRGDIRAAQVGRDLPLLAITIDRRHEILPRNAFKLSVLHDNR